MRRTVSLLTILLPLSAFSQVRQVNRHVIGVKEPLTAPSGRQPRAIAQDFLNSRATELGLSTADLGSAYVVRQYTDAHNGVTHILYCQQFQGIDVHNSGYVVNIDSDGRVLNAGGDLFATPQEALPEPTSSLAAVRTAVRSVNPRAAKRFVPFESQAAPQRRGAVRFTQGDLPEDPEGRMVWYAVHGTVVPAWQVFVMAEDGATRYSVISDTHQHVLSRRVMTYFQSPPPPRGLVFERESPQPNPKPGTLLLTAPPIAERTLQSFAGDPTASPIGWVANNETKGNNATVGENLLGLEPFGFTTPFIPVVTTKAPNGDFSFPLQLGAGAPNPLHFTDAINTNLFYWVNRAHDLHYAAGFTEAAGNFQANNFGKGGVEGDAITAFSHFGTASPQFAQIENAFFTSVDDVDGSNSFIAMYISDGGTGGIITDGSLDSGVIIHEYTHGVTNRLLPRGYDTFQVAAMGEAWSDFYAIEFLTPNGAPTDGVYPATQYFLQSWGQDSVRSRPYSTNLEVNPLTFANIGAVLPYQEVHADGEIWMEALWEGRANLIKQLGEQEGRRRIRMLVLDGIKLAPPGSSMVDMRDAILLADRTDFKGASQDQLWAAFAKRGLGALAYSGNPNTTHVLPSFALPSNKGQIALYDSPLPIGDLARVVVNDDNATGSALAVQMVSNSGDIETVGLRKRGSIYIGSLSTSGNVVNRENGTLNLMTGDFVAAYYTDGNAPGGSTQVYASTPTQNPYYPTVAQSSTYTFDSSNERLLNTLGFSAKVDLPFDFPFFGSKYRTLFVHDNGLISFGATADLGDLTSGCTDSNSLSQITGIAPLWLNMTSDGVAQDNEGVFVTRNIVDQVTVRWAGETVSPFGSDGNPVNVAATLFYDGRIQFQYGKGNAELASADNPTFCGPSPTVGISPGHDTYTLEMPLPSYNNAFVRFDPPFGTNSIPVAIIETPKPDDTVQDVVKVSGIAYDAASPITKIDILIDNIKRLTTRPTLARADFCAQQRVNGCPTVGFSANINTATLAPGTHTLRIRVTNSRAGVADFPAQPISFKTAAGNFSLPFGKIESPAEGAELKGSISVRGYAAANDLRIVLVDTLIDGISYGPTTYGVRRTDICGTLSPVPLNCPAIGFQFTLNTVNELPPIADGPHSVQMRVQDETGRYTLVPDTPVNFTVKNGERGSIVAAITSVQPGTTLKGTVDISGYAYAVGTTITRAVLVVDGTFDYGTVTLGQPRPELCATLPNVSACPNIGFTISFDTTRIGNGPHTLAVGVVTPTSTVLVPQVGSPVLSVVVNNP
jgi:hypothetical protein